MKDSEKFPFIVLTLRRTGGTSLVSFMSELSDFETVQHEPFNVDRIWGNIVSQFLESGNNEELKNNISIVLSKRPNIKHCFEIIPLGVTVALIDLCKKFGYKFFLLTRSNEVERIISLEIAVATNVWGPSDARIQYSKILSGQVNVPPVDVEEAIRGYYRDAAVLGQVVRALRHRNIHFNWLIFEEIYSGAIGSSNHVIDIAYSLGRRISADNSKLSFLKFEARQDSKSIKSHVPNIDVLKQRLEILDVS